MSTILDETTKSLARIQTTDPRALARSAELGPQFNLGTVVAPAERLISVFQRIPPSVLADLPDNHLGAIRQQSDSLHNVLEEIRTFNVEGGSIAAFRQEKVRQLTEMFPGVWGALSPYISYASSQSVDFQRLEREGRAAVQNIHDRTAELLAELKRTKEQADEALAAARRAASEQGVSQQAIYFRDAAQEHETEAEKWRSRTVNFAFGLGAYAVASLFLHKWAYLTPSNPLEATQLVTSKILLFVVISYMLLLSAKNYLSNRHNAVVNRHRQNALMTFNALALAAQDGAAKDIILTHAAACIFGPQDTGYAKGASTTESSLAQAAAGLLAKSDRGSGGAG